MDEKIFAEFKKNFLFVSDSRTEEILAMDNEFVKKYLALGLLIFGLLFILLSLLQGINLFSGIMVALFGIVVSSLILAIFAYVLDMIFHNAERNFIDMLKIMVIGNTPIYVFGSVPLIGFLASLVALSNAVLLIAKAYKQEKVKVAVIYILVGAGIYFILITALNLFAAGPRAHY